MDIDDSEGRSLWFQLINLSRAAVAKFRALKLVPGFSMGIDMDQVDRAIGRKATQDGVGDSMVATGAKRDNTCSANGAVISGNIIGDLLKVVDR